MRKKYIFFDIDGTLTYNDRTKGTSTVPDSTYKALDALRKNGHFVSIATGRSHWMAMSVVNQIGIDNLVTDGGNGIVLDGKLVELLPLDPAVINPLITNLDKDSIGYGVMLSDDNRIFYKNEIFLQKVQEFPAFQYVFAQDLDFCQKNVYKIFIGLTLKEESAYPILTKIPHIRYRDTALMIEPMDKYAGILRVMQYIHGSTDDIVVFGDGWNDIDMFSKAPLSVAMGNAVEPLKKQASFITKPVNEDGIAYACRHFGWI